MKKSPLFLIFTFMAFSLLGQDITRTNILPEIAIEGRGADTLLLIPCMGCRWNAWEEFMERNAEKYTMFAVTLPGYGGTEIPDIPHNTAGTPFRENILAGLSELMAQYNMENVIVVGHSWGVMPSVQLAAREKERVKKIIAIDGKIHSNTWLADDPAERIAEANSIVKTYSEKLKDPEEWRRFNGTGGLPYDDMVKREEALQSIKLVGSFMASNQAAVLQYWRENKLVDLTKELKKIDAPFLDIQSFVGRNQIAQKEKYLENIKIANVPENVKNVFMFDTKHFVMYHRPRVLDCMIYNFISELEVTDYAPAESEYFEEEMN